LKKLVLQFKIITMKILLFDNYDSFTYNLLHLIQSITDVTIDVFRNDAISLEEVNQYDKIILSPGPGVPQDAGLLLPLIKQYAPIKSIFGVCLGHQAIGQSFGGQLHNLKDVYHGVATNCNITNSNATLLQGLNKNFTIGRYHSWVVDAHTVPTDMEVTAVDDDGLIMAMQHKTYDVHGVQFHPESILTPDGKIIMQNFLKERI
jgi:anthranilate synthase component II